MGDLQIEKKITCVQKDSCSSLCVCILHRSSPSLPRHSSSESPSLLLVVSDTSPFPLPLFWFSVYLCLFLYSILVSFCLPLPVSTVFSGPLFRSDLSPGTVVSGSKSIRLDFFLPSLCTSLSVLRSKFLPFGPEGSPEARPAYLPGHYEVPRHRMGCD